MKKIFALLISAMLFCAPVSAKYDSYIDTARADGVISGDEFGFFDADKIATRAEFAVMLAKYFNLSGGINTFSDVKESDWFATAISAVHHAELFSGDPDGNAMPYAQLTLKDCVTVLGRKYTAPQNTDTNLESYASPYLAYAEEHGLISSNNYDALVTKGEALRLIYDYDDVFGGDVRFLAGYPRISSEKEFNKISVDIKTNVSCTVYYRLAGAGTADGAEHVLCRADAKTEQTVAVAANINKEYSLYLRAAADNGSEKTAVLSSVRPFSIAIGSGSQDDPYMIYTPIQLEQISDAYYRLGSDIVLDGTRNVIENFSGTLDGDGFKITIDGGRDNTDGLFGTIEKGAAIKNLTVYSDVKTGKNGGIIAKINNGTISGCAALGSLEVKTDAAGGICGQNFGNIENCLSAAYSVASGSFAGGICGQNFGNIENCLSAAEIVASQMYAGGICGTNEGGYVKNSVAANMTVYDSLTANSGRLTTNRKNGISENNYCYDGIISNAAYEETGKYSQNGYDVSWDELCDEKFYKNLGWSKDCWSKKEGEYRLISPKKTAQIELIPGKTMYYPKLISTAAELREIDKNSNGHYALGCDITLSVPWKTICGNGFSGTLDGNGFTVYNLDLRGETGMFSNITGGSVKNFTLKNAKSAPTSPGAILTACNYGYIENCKIYGSITTKKTGYIGTFAGENHGAVTGCEAYVDITVTDSNVTCGGICAENDGHVIDCMYSGKITVKGENAVVGGICGYDTGGNIFESFALPTLSMTGGSGYIGGVCGIMSGTGAYKCASSGSISSEVDDGIYSGGICALESGAVLYNAFSAAEVRSSAASGYIGGICGYATDSNIQNTYSSGTVISVGGAVVGGICGSGEGSYIMQNVALNPSISGKSDADCIIAKASICGISDNYFSERLLLNGKHTSTSIGGTVKSFSSLKKLEFYLRPVSDGGLLGWESDTWLDADGAYAFPVLSDVKGMQKLKMPTYK